MIVKVVVPDSIYARVYFARGEQGPQGPTGNTGPQGPSGIVNVDSPITNSGTSTAANIGINQALLQLAPAQVTGTAVITTDPRLSDQRVPADGSVTDTKIVAGGLSPNRVAGTAVITTDSRLSDARTPLAHASTHGSAGSDPVTVAQSQVTGLVSALSAKAPIDSPAFTTKVTIPVTSGVFLGTNSLGEIYKVGSAPGLGYLPYTAAVSQGIAWQALSELVRTNVANIITSPADASVPLQLRRFSATATANIQEWDDQTGAVLSAIGPSGAFSAPQASITGTVASNIPLQITGAASQSTHFLNVQTSASATLFRVNSSGYAMAPLGFISGGTTQAGTTATSVYATAAGNIGLVVRGAASQSANMQQWQLSDSTVVARVLSDGQFVSSAINTSNNYARMLEANSGGTLQLTKMTAQAGNAGAGIGRLYFRDGTNAGTLKLVVRAGAAGAETTILDNIPQ